MRSPVSKKVSSNRASSITSVPSRQELITYLKDLSFMPSKREIARAFGIKGGAQKIALKKLLRKLGEEGIYKHRPRKNPTQFVPKKAARLPAEQLLKPDDFCQIGACLVGSVQKTSQGIKFIPSQRQVRHIFNVTNFKSFPKEQVGGIFRATVVKDSPLTVELREHLGSVADISLISSAIADLPRHFQERTLAETKNFSVPAVGKREDIRHLPLVTIDGKDSRDFDDAVWAEPYERKEEKGWHLIVAIADVAYYVRPNGSLDKEALERGTSVYFPDSVIPMLPEALSNDLCSLRPHEDRACVGVHLWIDEKGKKIRQHFFRGLMRSHARLTYEQAQRIYDAKETHPQQKAIQNLYGAYKALDYARRERGTLEIDLPEPYILLDPKGHMTGIELKERLDSHRLIEEFMVTANVAAAEFLESHRVPCLYRIHAPPDAEKTDNLRRVLRHLKINFKDPLKTPADFTRLLEYVKDSPHADIINELVLRCQSQAIYSPDNIGHFGLNLSHYCHFTSPIRRYPDLLVHRGIVSVLGYEDGLSPHIEEKFKLLGEETSFKERRADGAQREAIDRFMTHYLSSQIGHIFEGYISGINKAGIFVSLKDNGASGLIPMRTLGDDYYKLLENPPRLEGRHNKKMYFLGDQVKIKLTEADLNKGRLTFSLPSVSG